MHTATKTAPALKAINHDGPIKVTCRDNPGFEWTVTPDRFEFLVGMVNATGGPAAWVLTPLG